VTEELEYTGLMALGWDALRGDTSAWEDRAFYLDLIRACGEPVLDVGCGTGRLLLDYLGLGIDIDGVEIPPDMVAILRAKANQAGLDLGRRVQLGAMESLDLPRRYRVILVPSSSFQLLLDPAHARAAMAGFRDHLAPGGTLAMPWIDVAQDHPGGAEDRFEKEALLSDGSTIRRTYRGWYDPTTELEHTDDLYERIVDGIVVERERQVRSPATRHYSTPAITALHEAAGFGDVRFLSGFSDEPMQPSDRIVTTLAKR
jgi:SAM-dependent methyltransferase